MAYEFQVAVDCADPHTLAGWWAETLGWQVEPSDEAFIRRMISAGYAAESDTLLHNGVLVWKDGAAIRHPDGLERAPRLLFQQVPEPKTVKNRHAPGRAHRWTTWSPRSRGWSRAGRNFCTTASRDRTPG